MEQYKVRRRRPVLYWILVIIWMIMIFYLSHQPAGQSNGLSTGITEKIIDMFKLIIPNVSIDLASFNHIIRKNAHFFVYLVLGILVVNGLNTSGVSGFRLVGLALFICVIYAMSDEIHQLYIQGRSGQVKDVIIDSTGALVGIEIYWGIKVTYRRWKRKYI